MKKQFTLLFAISLCLNSSLFSQIHIPDSLRHSKKSIYKEEHRKSSVMKTSCDSIRKVQIREYNPNSYLFKKEKKKKVTEEEILSKIKIEMTNNGYKKSNENRLEIVKQETDIRGMTHSWYQQKYKGFLIKGAELVIHTKNENVNSFNGKYYKNINLDISNLLSVEKVYEAFVKAYNITTTIEDVDIDTLIVNHNNDFLIAYKIKLRNISNSYDYYYDAKNGEFIYRISNIWNAVGTGLTFNRGTQIFETEDIGNAFRLKDNIRNIETLDFSKVYTMPYNPEDFIDSNNIWDENIHFVKNISVTAINDNWWSFFNENPSFGGKPDIFIVLYDDDNNLIRITNPIPDAFPEVSFEINKFVNKYPLHLEVYDSDMNSSSDLLGVFLINEPSSSTIINFSNSGTSGNIEIELKGNPALDVHWGMIQTYDFYKNICNRNSFDNSGSLIQNLVGFNYIEIFGEQDNNNAGALSGTNIMIYGMGDGITYYPFVALDVEAHEFTHLVTRNTAQLEYKGESGAINEGLSDIFAVAVEYYTDSLNYNWSIGEEVMIQEPYMRLMSNPNVMQDPDTYHDEFWKNTEDSLDNGGVHSNSGVLNYWFYLLTEGGSGTNYNNNAYNVTGIGMSKSIQICYSLLANGYLTSESNFLDAYYQSLTVAEDLYLPDSPEYWAVKNAWYAVGVINTDPNMFCEGTILLSDQQGTFSDGSGGSNYANNSNCKWLIQPKGAESITLTFTSFDIEMGYDSVFIYSSIEANPLYLHSVWSGNTLPPPITISGGAVTVEFKSDNIVTAGGWDASYTSVGNIYCNGETILSDYSGSFSDGSGFANYSNNQECAWIIAPPGADTVILNFTSFDTESGFDEVYVLDDYNFDVANLLGIFSGTLVPSTIISATGKMAIVFISDSYVTSQGFDANYSTAGTPFCKGDTLITKESGYISDGSYDSTYYNNSNCGWLIQPPNATSISLIFTEMNLEFPTEDGKTYYDFVEVYDGVNDQDSLLGRFAGTNIPPVITSSGGSIYIKFQSDLMIRDQGWSAYYYSTTPIYCNGTTELNSISGVISDGSGIENYGNNSDCMWLIQPPNATSVTLSFTEFEVENNFDGVIIYDGIDTTANILGTYTGDSIPLDVTSTGGSMLIWFLSDESVSFSGWSANYTSCILPDVPTTPTGEVELCINSSNIDYSTTSTANATSYIWEILPIGAGVITGATTTASVDWDNAFTGTATISVKGVNSCNDKGTFSNVLTVDVNSLPTANAGTSIAICKNDSTTLNASGGTSFSWTPAINLSATDISNPIANPDSTITYTVNVIDINGCKDTANVTITVNSLPSVPIINKIGNQLQSSAISGNQWYESGNLISGATSQTYTPIQSGLYTVIVTDVTSCSSESVPFSFVVASINSNLSELGINVFPNPTTGNISITGKDISFIEITNIAGQVIEQVNVNKHQYDIDLSFNPKGIYLLKIVTNKGIVVERIVLSK